MSPKLKSDYKQNLHLWTIAYFALVALVKSNKHRSGRLTPDAFNRAINLYNSADNAFETDDDAEIERFLKRTLFQQLPMQQEWWSGMARAAFLFDAMNGLHEQALAGAVSRIFSLSYQGIVDSCFSIYLAFRQKSSDTPTCCLTLDELQTKWVPWLARDVLDGLVGHMSQNQNEFRAMYEKLKPRARSLRKYAFNPLYSRPLICIDGCYYAPVPSLIPRWATDGIIYTLSQSADDSGSAGAFYDTLGHAFEDYVASLLAQYGACYHRDEQLKVQGGAIAPCDFIIVEGETALLAECKSRRVVASHRAAEPEDADRVYDEIRKGLKQTHHTEEMIRQKQGWLGENDSISNSTAFVHLVVTMDDYYDANSSSVWERITTQLPKGLVGCVATARELEILLANIPAASLVSEINESVRQRNLLPPSLADRIRHRLRRGEIDRIMDPGKAIVLDTVQRLTDALQ